VVAPFVGGSHGDNAVHREVLAAVVMFGAVLHASADDPSDSIGRTPPRLSYAEGEVSFWRPGAEDWAPAQVNTPLAPVTSSTRDTRAISSCRSATARSCVRGAIRRSASRIRTGFPADQGDRRPRLARSPDSRPRRTIELDTPSAAFTIERAGYYRVDVTADRTSSSRDRGARDDDAGGRTPLAVAPSEESCSRPGRHRLRTATSRPSSTRGIAGTTRAPMSCSSRSVRATCRPACTARTSSIIMAIGASCRSTARSGCRKRYRWDGSLQHRTMGVGSVLWLDLVDTRAVGLGSLSLRSLGLR